MTSISLRIGTGTPFSFSTSPTLPVRDSRPSWSTNGLANPTVCVVAGNRAYLPMVQGDGVAVVDIADPMNPRFLTSFRDPVLKKTYGVALHDGLLFVGARRREQPGCDRPAHVGVRSPWSRGSAARSQMGAGKPTSCPSLAPGRGTTHGVSIDWPPRT